MDSNIFNGGLVLIVLRGYCEAAKEDEKEKMLPERKKPLLTAKQVKAMKNKVQ